MFKKPNQFLSIASVTACVFVACFFFTSHTQAAILNTSIIKKVSDVVVNKGATSTKATTTTDTVDSKNFTTSLDINKKYKVGEEVVFSYSIKNKSLKTLKFDFTSGCQLKIAGPIVDESMICTQALTNVSIAPGRSHSWTQEGTITSNATLGEQTFSAQLIGYDATKATAKATIVNVSTGTTTNATTTPATSTESTFSKIKVPVKFDISKPKTEKNATTSESTLTVKRSSIKSIIVDFLRKKNPVTKWTLDVSCPANVSVWSQTSTTSASLCGTTKFISQGDDASKTTNIKEKLTIKNTASSTAAISFTVKAYDQYGVVGSSTEQIMVKPSAGSTTGTTTLEGKTFLNIPYAVHSGSDANLTSLDIYTPKEVSKMKKASPVAILVHGGGWQNGDKASKDFLTQKQKFFNGLGYVVVSINYRLSPEVEHPAHIEDVTTAINWVEENITKYGGDPTKLVLLGHSAGAHLVLLATTDEGQLQASGVNRESIKAVISLDTASTDMPLRISLTENASSTPEQEFIDDLQLEKFYNAFTHDVNVQKDASPYYQITQGEEISPLFLAYVASREDTVVQREQFTEKLDQLTETEYKLGVYEGYSHSTINQKFGKSNDKVTKDAKKFLQKYVK